MTATLPAPARADETEPGGDLVVDTSLADNQVTEAPTEAPAVVVEQPSRRRKVRKTQKAKPAARLRSLIAPPDIWDEPRPTLQEVWGYARHGEWTGTGTAGRFLGVLYALAVSFPLHAVGYMSLWVAERPARVAVIFALLAPPLILTPAGYTLLTSAANVLLWLAALIRPEGV